MLQTLDLPSAAACIAQHARRNPDARAIIEDGAAVGYRDLAADIVRTVRLLERNGVQPGGVIGTEHPRHYPHLLLVLACSVIGATSLSLSADEISSSHRLLQQCTMLVTVGTPGPEYRGRTVMLDYHFVRTGRVVVVGVEQLDLLDRHVPPDEVVRITKSSGTTGSPRTMAIPHGVMQRIIWQTLDYVIADLSSRPSFLCLYSLGVRAAYSRVLGTLMHGGEVHFAMGDDTGGLIGSGAVNYALFLVGDLERALPRLPSAPQGHVLDVEVIGGPVSLQLRQAARERLNGRLIVTYSSNETNRVAIMGDDGIGVLCPGVEVRIVDPAGHELPFGSVGLICIKTATLAPGYNNDPAASAACFVDGWYHSTDLGYMPEAGRLVVVGRADDILVIGGIKIAPFEVEEAIKRFDGISDAAVLSGKDLNGHDQLLVALELGGDRAPPDLAQRIADVMSRFDRPCEFLALRQFPRTETGKVRRQEIRAMFQRPGGPGTVA